MGSAVLPHNVQHAVCVSAPSPSWRDPECSLSLSLSLSLSPPASLPYDVRWMGAAKDSASFPFAGIMDEIGFPGDA